MNDYFGSKTPSAEHASASFIGIVKTFATIVVASVKSILGIQTSAMLRIVIADVPETGFWRSDLIIDLA